MFGEATGSINKVPLVGGILLYDFNAKKNN
jgi:hypothetical protein